MVKVILVIRTGFAADAIPYTRCGSGRNLRMRSCPSCRAPLALLELSSPSSSSGCSVTLLFLLANIPIYDGHLKRNCLYFMLSLFKIIECSLRFYAVAASGSFPACPPGQAGWRRHSPPAAATRATIY